jgi:hypothetical protein
LLRAICIGSPHCLNCERFSLAFPARPDFAS